MHSSMVYKIQFIVKILHAALERVVITYIIIDYQPF